jgi:ABC-type transport system involved in multi-copper enzyme maturation permease subunit
MFRVLFYKELRENIQNYRFIIALILCLTIIPVSFYINGKDFQAKEQNFRESVRLYEESHKTVLDVIEQGGAAFRPPSPLSILSSGVEFLLPSSVESVGNLVTYLGAQTQFNNNRSFDNPISFLYGSMDLAFIVCIIISLLAILFTYNSVAGEKEGHTLSQILSNPLPRNIVILAKMSANFLFLSLAFFLAIVIGIFVLLLTGFEILSSGSLLLCFFLGVGVSLLYIFSFLNFGLLVSSLNKSSISSIVSLMFCWAFLFMIFPKGSLVVSKIIKPIKSQQVIDLEKNQIRLQIEKEEKMEAQKLKETMPDVREMTPNEFFKKLFQGDKIAKGFEKKQNELKEFYKVKCESELNKIDSYYESQRNSQALLAQNISRLSLVSCFIHFIVEISNTGFCEYEQWKLTRSRFKLLLDKEISSKEASAWFGIMGYSTFHGDPNAPMPKLKYQPVPLHEAISSVLPDFILLVLYGVLFFAGAYVAFLKYDVR